MIKKLIFSASILLATGWLGAQPGVRAVKVFSAFDVDDTSYHYCVPSVPVAFVACDALGTGTGANDGWVGVRSLTQKMVIIRVDAIALAAGSIDFTVEGRWTDSTGTKATATLIAPISKTMVEAGQVVRIPENVEEIRVGVRINGADDADAVPDSVTVHIDAT